MLTSKMLRTFQITLKKASHASSKFTKIKSFNLNGHTTTRLFSKYDRGNEEENFQPNRATPDRSSSTDKKGENTGEEEKGKEEEYPGYEPEEDQASFVSDKKFSQFVLFTGAFALLFLFIASNVITLKKEKEMKQKQKVGEVTYAGKADIGGTWVLYDTQGNVVTNKNFIGKYYLIYFGFTLCPDVCPISLQKLAKSLRKIKKAKEYRYFDLECIFVSVDPDRDTPERIERYCKIFDDSIIGLTHKSNEHPELKDMLKKFKIHSSKIYLTEEEELEDAEALKTNAPEVIEKMSDSTIQPKKQEKYSLDHTIVTYLIGPDNEFLTYLGSNLNEVEMTEIILDEISSDLGKRYIGTDKGAPLMKASK